MAEEHTGNPLREGEGEREKEKEEGMDGAKREKIVEDVDEEGEGNEEEQIMQVTEGYRLKIVEVLDELERREICDLIHDVHTHFLAPIQHEVFSSLPSFKS